MSMPLKSIKHDVSMTCSISLYLFVDVNLGYLYIVQHLQVQHLSIGTLISLLALIYHF